jgi:branched-subunit amino acid ABC-type transport system permease component
MVDPDSVLALAALAALLISVVAAWSLWRRLRNRASRWFAGSVTLLATWPFLSSASSYMLLTYGNPANPHPATSWLFVTIEVFLPATLFLVVASSFWLSVRSITARPKSH